MSSQNESAPGDRALALEVEKTVAEGPPPLIQKHPEEHPEKGSLRSMWELLMQLRVLLPYLTRLVPLLDRGLLKVSPDLTEIQKGIQDVSGRNRDLGTLARNQGLQLERMEEQLLRLREAGERRQQDLRELSARLDALLRWTRSVVILCILLLLLVGSVLGLLLARL